MDIVIHGVISQDRDSKSDIVANRCILLSKGESFNLSQRATHLRILSGLAWAVIDQQDQILRAGQEVDLPSAKHPTTLIVLAEDPLIVEVDYGAEPPPWQRLQRAIRSWLNGMTV